MNEPGQIKKQNINKITALILFFFGTSYGFAQQADDIIGKYHLPNKLDVEIFKIDGKYFGKIIALNGFEKGQTSDLNNPDKEKQNDLLLGKVIIEGFEFDPEEKEWRNGSMYASEKGMVFNLKVTDIRETEIEVVGSKFIIWRTLTWQKI